MRFVWQISGPLATVVHLSNHIFGFIDDIHHIEDCYGQNKYLKPQFEGHFGQIAGFANQP